MLFSSIGPRFTASHIFQFHLAMAFWSMPLHSHQFPLQHSRNAHWKKKNDVTKIQSCHICCIRSFFSWMKHFASFYFVAFFPHQFTWCSRFDCIIFKIFDWFRIFAVALLKSNRSKSLSSQLVCTLLLLIWNCFPHKYE